MCTALNSIRWSSRFGKLSCAVDVISLASSNIIQKSIYFCDTQATCGILVKCRATINLRDMWEAWTVERLTQCLVLGSDPWLHEIWIFPGFLFRLQAEYNLSKGSAGRPQFCVRCLPPLTAGQSHSILVLFLVSFVCYISFLVQCASIVIW